MAPNNLDSRAVEDGVVDVSCISSYMNPIYPNEAWTKSPND